MDDDAAANKYLAVLLKYLLLSGGNLYDDRTPELKQALMDRYNAYGKLNAAQCARVEARKLELVRQTRKALRGNGREPRR